MNRRSQMNGALVAVRRTALLCLTMSTIGCTTLRSWVTPDEPTAPDTSVAAPKPPVVSDRAVYTVQVDAPSTLRTLLLTYLDLSRFQSAPETESITTTELDRLVSGVPSQARALLETEGYFNAVVEVLRETPADGGKPVLRVKVAPGPRTTVGGVSIDVHGPLDDAVKLRDAAGVRIFEDFRRAWPLKPGQPMRQSSWSGAKSSTIARLRADGYAAASWRETVARVDAEANRAALKVDAESGPLFRFGGIHIEGLKRHDESSVLNLATFTPGTPYTEQLLLDYQDRLQKVDLFQSISVEIQPDVENADAVPVNVRVTEQPLQQATYGIGFSANNGPRTTLEYTHRRPFDIPWIAKSKLEYGSSLKQLDLDLKSHPLEGLWRNVVAGNVQRLRSVDEVRAAWNLRVGRIKEGARIDRLYFAELTHARVDNPAGASSREAVTGNYHWTWRDIDSVLLPTRGTTLATQGALGYARANDADNGPFGRAYGRLTWYRPFAGNWFGVARLEAGQIFSKASVGVPDTLLFRAGGDDSVRGYSYRSLGPLKNGVVESGRMLLTGSIEVAHPIFASRPEFLWATFLDAGQSANSWSDLKPVYGYGVGLRYRSPVGPLRVDLAYGQAVRRVRLHVSVGVAF